MAVRAMSGETAWLDGRMVWHGGRVFWESQGRLFAPTAADLSLAQRRLNQVRRYPIAGEQALGDLSAWLAWRCARLEIAKRVYSVRADDFLSVSQYLRKPDAYSIERLSALLVTESACASTLPMSAAHALAAYGERAEQAMCAIMSYRSLPSIARALAALTLGTVHKQTAHTGSMSRWTPPSAAQVTGWMQRAYSWGLRLGMPDEPMLYVKLLSHEDGASLARRYEVTAKLGAPFQLDSGLIHDLLADGAPPKKVVSLAEALLAVAPLANLVLDYRDLLPDRPAKKRHETAERLHAERHALLTSLAETLYGYIRSTPDPATVEAFAQLAYTVLELDEPVEQLLNHLLDVLRSGLSLPNAQQLSYLELLIEHREQMWDTSCRRDDKSFDWLLHCQTYHIKPLFRLLNKTKNVEIVREAVLLGIYYVLSTHRWQDLDRYRCMLSLARDLDLREDFYLAGRLCEVVDNFADMSAAHMALQSLIRPLMRHDIGLRLEVARGVFYEIPYSRQGQHQAFSKLLPYFPRLVRFITEDTSRMQLLPRLVQSILEFPRFGLGEDQGVIWLDWMFNYLTERAEKLENGYADLHGALGAASVALLLAAGDLARFQAVFRAAMEHDLDYEWETLEAGIRVLSRIAHASGYQHSRLLAALAGIFPRQPHRCIKLIEQIGLLPRFGKQPLATLASLEPLAPGGDTVPNPALLPDDWQPLIASVPELLPDALSYLRAQQLVGGDGRLPAGVRRLVEQPSRWAGELTYLQALLESHPERADLAIRERNLRARLADGEAVLRNMRGELSESLRNLTAQAELEALEGRVAACYQQYLESIAGSIPLQVELNDHLRNAALLTTNIRSNRRLLLKLLRAYLGGERRWPERHPINIEYLGKLRAAGVDTRNWLRSHPRVYRCKGVASGRIHLRLERDPLSTLQMGNYFGTCLRLGGVNAFSTVANACELNKRVIYARDGKGNVVGRKLIGISMEGKLVGFQTYCSLDEEAGGRELRALFDRYAAQFARRCGLELASEGTVPRLFAQSWYDDGAVPWNPMTSPDSEASQGKKGHSLPPDDMIGNGVANAEVLVGRRRARARGAKVRLD
jgi:hypothetical protein